MKKTIKRLYNFILKGDLEYLNPSFSQEGEDLILKRYFHGKEKGFYLDIGAHHPRRFSNTYIFYKSGWNGINIDPRPGCMQLFNSRRPRDINLELGISRNEEELIYYMFNDSALNTFNGELAQNRVDQTAYRIIDKKKIKTFPLHKILSEYLEDGANIDFMTIDVEGLEIEVLLSSDWNKFRPTLLLIEDLNRKNMYEFGEGDLYKMMAEIEYTPFAKTINTVFFKDDKSI